ncbi:putative disease resistance protein RGA1 [Eucalyptus grandis]|uniref:putative disease resistance protein RGA1 n=1 Tax=Eucalyptus grandis TaxID=71139 RepID=UPI00192EBF44|nr:putative disease resistance protein RGA1 [Eucalyptus grandis]
MADVVIGSIAEKIVAILGSQATETVGKLWALKHELKALENTVSTLRAVLHHAEEQYYQSSQVKDWVEKLKDALYDAEDVLEEFNIEALQPKLRGHKKMMKEVKTFFSSSNQLAFKLKMGYKVRAVRESIEAIKADRIFYLEERPVDSEAEREQRKRRETHSFIPEGYIIGRDADKKTVKGFLMDSNMEEPISILPIVGIGGLGKTALAQSVYNDEMVGNWFELKMWVCVSDDFDLIKIVKNIIACVKNEKPTEDTMEQLQRKLRAEIDGKRYLLVLDDLWNIELEKWLSLKILLGGGGRGSKILITTRLLPVVKITGTTSPYLLEDLSESASVDLLMQIACQKVEERQDSEMLAIAIEIVRKCSGVPLVIRTVGSLLFFKKTKREWLDFKNHELPEVSQREDCIKSVLKLSYDHLPSHLKQCFAFCSLFPKDYKIKKHTLVDLWIAEGFIQPSNRGQHLEDIAHGYFMDLLWSNFFQDFKEDPFTGEEICKMHDLMHDLACLVARTECWVAWDDTKLILERTRHISCDSTSNLMGKPQISCLKASALRTFLSVTTYWGMEPTSEANLCQLIQSFKRLRILDLHAKKVEKVPMSIYKLKHLTYLDLSYNHALKRLPDSITRLQNLQTLNLHHCGSLEELPRGIRKLVNLQDLNIDNCDKLSYMPCGLEQLTSLHRLICFILPKDKALAKKYCKLGELNRLNNIRGRLYIKNLGSVIDAIEESMAANLIEKHSLEFLILSWGSFNSIDEVMITKRDDAMIMKRDEALLDGLRPPDNLQKLIIDKYDGESFPRWMTELPNLVELRLIKCERCKHFPKFGLSKLKRLDISGMEFLEYLPGESLGSLTSLESLDIYLLHRLTSLPLGLRHLSKLVHLSIKACHDLDLSKDESGNILDFHGGLQSLRSMHISFLPKLTSLPQWILQLRSECPNFKEQISSVSKFGIARIIRHYQSKSRNVRSWIYPKTKAATSWISMEAFRISAPYTSMTFPN